MGSDYKKLYELETALRQLRDDLNDLSIKVSAEPRNTSHMKQARATSSYQTKVRPST